VPIHTFPLSSGNTAENRRRSPATAGRNCFSTSPFASYSEPLFIPIQTVPPGPAASAVG